MTIAERETAYQTVRSAIGEAIATLVIQGQSQKLLPCNIHDHASRIAKDAVAMVRRIADDDLIRESNKNAEIAEHKKRNARKKAAGY